MSRAISVAVPLATSLIAILAAQSCTHRVPGDARSAVGSAPTHMGRAPAAEPTPSASYGYGASHPLEGEPIDVRRSASPGVEGAGSPTDAGLSIQTNFSATPTLPARPARLRSGFRDVEELPPVNRAAPAHFGRTPSEADTGVGHPVEGPADSALPGAAGDSEVESMGPETRAPLEEGLAITRGAEFTGRETATGERFDAGAPMAAHPSLPLPSLAEIVNLENGRRTVVRVNDRQAGP